MSKHHNGLGVPLDDPRFFLQEGAKKQPVKSEGLPLVGEFGWPAGEEGRKMRALLQQQGVIAEGTGE
ncbi:MAG: hypothetical protein PHS73_02340 [Candidatus Peribacteraceae bacterium]|nr:hypothetical protein [Candidatus Peribacteraceae bacterium]